MERELKKFFRLLRNALLVDVFLYAIIGMICWYGDWRSYYEYGIGLSWGGGLTMIVGLYSLLGNLGFGNLKLDKLFSLPNPNRDAEDNGLPQSPHTFFVMMFIAGSFAIIGGEILQKM